MRLIDADALEQQFNEERRLFAEQDMKGAEHVLVHSALMLLREAPIIDAVPRWIPCDERLPENESEVLVTDNNGHIRHAFYVSKWDWFGTYEESMTIRAIAWMPLPEPYDGERKDDD